MIRAPAVAGQFYPANSKDLQQLIAELRAQLRPLRPRRPRALLVPHAGYHYSGLTAAQAYEQLLPFRQEIRRVVLLGVSHRQFFAEAAIYPNGEWLTPLGAVTVAEAEARTLVRGHSFFKVDYTIHQAEHTLEVQLPFLQTILPSSQWQIIPLLLGSPESAPARRVAAALTSIWAEDFLLVISSDLAHYPPPSLITSIDRETLSGILSGKVKVLEKKIRANEEKNYPGLETCACGLGAIKSGLFLAQRLSWRKKELLHYSHSGQVDPGATLAVGYAAVGFYE